MILVETTPPNSSDIFIPTLKIDSNDLSVVRHIIQQAGYHIIVFSDNEGRMTFGKTLEHLPFRRRAEHIVGRFGIVDAVESDYQDVISMTEFRELVLNVG
jgi:hypothetical protein